MVDGALQSRLYIGCAGWNIPRSSSANFPSEGSHLEKYASRLNAVEINTSFYRPHRPSTYARWAAAVPSHFQFSVKMPKQITHELRLRDASKLTERFLSEAGALGNGLGCVLVQLPPSLAFVPSVADAFFAHVRELHGGNIAFEPRHASWFSPDAEDVLHRYTVARVAADPALHPGAAQPAGFAAFNYIRLHGSPETYYSRYSDDFLCNLAGKLAAPKSEVREIWCIFDNTAAGHAIDNALQLLHTVRHSDGQVTSPEWDSFPPAAKEPTLKQI